MKEEPLSQSDGQAGGAQRSEAQARAALLACGHCGWIVSPPNEASAETCPHCFRAQLEPLSGADQSEDRPTFELAIPFGLTDSALRQTIETFARGIPFSPADLTPAHLLGRMQRLYVPMWLVDSKIRATWQGEAGFDYQVVSHQDSYDQNQGAWASREVLEERIRWEARIGRLERTYHNLPAPAVEEHARLKGRIGEFNPAAAVAPDPSLLSDAWIRMPNRLRADAWPDAIPGAQSRAADECRQAAGADHMRDFRWSPVCEQLNWSLLLLPLYASFYLDDEGGRHAVIVHGRSGRAFGSRKASMKRARRLSLILLGLAAALGLPGLLVLAISPFLPALFPFGPIILLLAFLISLGAVAPVAAAGRFNRWNAPG